MKTEMKSFIQKVLQNVEDKLDYKFESDTHRKNMIHYIYFMIVKEDDGSILDIPDEHCDRALYELCENLYKEIQKKKKISKIIYNIEDEMIQEAFYY